MVIILEINRYKKYTSYLDVDVRSVGGIGDSCSNHSNNKMIVNIL